MPILTISIPTYNRCKYLIELLHSIEKNTNPLNVKLFEVFIFDNCSTDNTLNTINNYSYAINIHKNSSNIGANKNIHQAYNTPNTPYIWVLGDDEILPHDSIDKILSILIYHKPGLLINRIHGHPLLTSLPTELPNYKSFLKIADEINPYLLIYHSYISANIIKKGLYDFEMYNEKNHNLYDWYFAIINAVSQSDIKICFSDQSTVIVRPERAEPVDVEDLRKYHNLVHHMQVEYLHWIKKKFNLNLTPENVVYDYVIACGR